MYYKDFSNYSYGINKTLPNVINIGWLDNEHQFNISDCSNEILGKLFDIILYKECNVMRGIHDCNICNSEGFLYEYKGGKKILLGHGEIWIPSIKENKIFASPTLIYHYIKLHGYMPPSDFIESLLAFDLLSDWNGDEVHRKLVR